MKHKKQTIAHQFVVNAKGMIALRKNSLLKGGDSFDSVTSHKGSIFQRDSLRLRSPLHLDRESPTPKRFDLMGGRDGSLQTGETPKHDEGIHLFIDLKKSSEASSFLPIRNHDVSNVFSDEDFEGNLFMRQEFAQRKFTDDKHTIETIKLGGSLNLKKKKSKEKAARSQLP